MKITIQLRGLAAEQIEVDNYRDFLRDVEACKARQQFVITGNLYISAVDIVKIIIPKEDIVVPVQLPYIEPVEEENNQPDAERWKAVMKDEINSNTGHEEHIKSTLEARKAGRPKKA